MNRLCANVGYSTPYSFDPASLDENRASGEAFSIPDVGVFDQNIPVFQVYCGIRSLLRPGQVPLRNPDTGKLHPSAPTLPTKSHTRHNILADGKSWFVGSFPAQLDSSQRRDRLLRE